MTEETTLFIDGLRDHECDAKGPMVYGGDHVPLTTEIAKAGQGYTWGSVTCSRCGTPAIALSVWQDDWNFGEEAAK